jgi:hypothetical protein
MTDANAVHRTAPFPTTFAARIASREAVRRACAMQRSCPTAIDARRGSSDAGARRGHWQRCRGLAQGGTLGRERARSIEV